MAASPPVDPDSPPSIDDRIVHASLTLISEQGLGGVTMSQIADVAGVARQTLYNRYDDIDSIVAVTIERHNRESIDLLGAAIAIAESPEDKIEQIVRHFANVGAHSHHPSDLHDALAPELRTALDSYRVAVEAHIREVLENGQKSGRFRSDLDLEVDTALIRSLLEGIQALAAKTPGQAAQIAATGTRTIVAALH